MTVITYSITEWPTCNNCGHWTNPRAITESGVTSIWGECARTGDDAEGELLMFYEVDPDPRPCYYPQITTRSDFGCVMFEAKGAA